jgi:hypothetical protein
MFGALRHPECATLIEHRFGDTLLVEQVIVMTGDQVALLQRPSPASRRKRSIALILAASITWL